MTALKTDRLLVLLAVAIALLVPLTQALTGWGQTAAEFADDGDATLRAAGYAFSIWGLIYAGLLAFAIYQLRLDGELASIRRPAALAAFGCGVWLVASALDWKWASVAIILVSAISAIAAVAQACRLDGLRQKLLVLYPIALLAGWLTIASALNVVTVLTAKGLIQDSARLPAVAIALGGVVAVAVTVTLRTRVSIYAAPVVWGLIAVGVAEAADPLKSWGAYAAAALTAVAALAALGPTRRPADPRGHT